MKQWGYQAIISLLLLQIGVTWCAPQASSQRSFFAEPSNRPPGPVKDYTRFRVSKDSQMVVYHHEQTVAVVELATGRQLLNCEQLEVKTNADRDATLQLLKSLKIKKHMGISFKDMLDLQKHCQELDTPNGFKPNPAGTSAPEQFNPIGITSVFHGIFPGTKWCGKGDLAPNYHILGRESKADKCCRTHDLCPVKVSGLATQYNITNYSMVTRSHCACDQGFYQCLKGTKSSLTDLIGTLYFNVGDPQCVDESENNGFLFRPNMLNYH